MITFQTFKTYNTYSSSFLGRNAKNAAKDTKPKKEEVLTDEIDTYIFSKTKSAKTKNKKPLTYMSSAGERSTSKRLPKSIEKAKEAVKEKTSLEILEMNGTKIIKRLSAENKQALTGGRELNGGTIISIFAAPSSQYGFSDIDVDEDKLIEGVEVIVGDLILRNSNLKSTHGIRFVGGDLVIGKESGIEDLSSIERIGNSVLVEAINEDEAREILKEKKLNFDAIRPGKKIITLPGMGVEIGVKRSKKEENN